MIGATTYWVAAAFALIAAWLNARRDPTCLAIWSFTNVVWMLADFTLGLPAQGTVHAAYLLLAVWGLLRWMRDERRRPPSSKPGVPHGTQAAA